MMMISFYFIFLIINHNLNIVLKPEATNMNNSKHKGMKFEVSPDLRNLLCCSSYIMTSLELYRSLINHVDRRNAWHKHHRNVVYLDHYLILFLGLKPVPHVSTIHFETLFDIVKRIHCKEMSTKSIDIYTSDRDSEKEKEKEKEDEDHANFLFSICPSDFVVF